MKAQTALPIVICAFVLALPLAVSGASHQLDVPVVEQEHSQWCWDADASAILAYRSVFARQCAIANWVDGIDYACGRYPFYWSDQANSPNYLAGTTGIAGILWSWGRRGSYYMGPLAYSTARSALERGNPIVILWNWSGGGGHFVVLDGYDDNGSMLYFMNPWPGEGAEYGDYWWIRYGSGDMGTHRWAESLITY
jgi:Papain-like cysteine protease AvrRpt2